MAKVSVLAVEDEPDVANLVRVTRLRAKFFSAGLPDPGIETIRGVGYRLGEPA
jgi:hypothetical protein